MTNPDELERLARAATPGPWVRDRLEPESIRDQMGDFVVMEVEATIDAAFIAAANPATILALLSANREMRGLLQKTTDLLASANRSTDRPSDYVSRVVMEARSALTTQRGVGE